MEFELDPQTVLEEIQNLFPKELTIAASRGNLDLVKSILGQGIDINAEGEDDI